MYFFCFFSQNTDMKKNILMIFIAVIIAAGFINGSSDNVSAVQFSAKSMIIIDASTNRVLFEHNAYEKLPMASTTKIMTAITAIEESDVNQVVTIPKAACGIEGSSIYLQEGEKLTLKHLLFGLMLRSGNDCAEAIALHVGGSLEGFSKMMNDKAQMLEVYDSNFVNPHGLHNKNHYTTAYDLAVIASYAMKNPIFREIVSTKKIEIPCTTRDYGRILINKNKMLSKYEGATGIKTGFTKQAGRCLVSSAKRNGMELICVVLNCGPMWEVSMQYMDKIFDKYHIETFLQPFTYWGEIEISNRREKKVGIYSRDNFAYPVCGEDENKITNRLEIPETLTAPLCKDAEIGKIKFYYDNQLIFSAKVYSINGINSLTYFEAAEKIIMEM